MLQKVRTTDMVCVSPGILSNIDNNEDYVMLPALAGPDGLEISQDRITVKPVALTEDAAF